MYPAHQKVTLSPFEATKQTRYGIMAEISSVKGHNNLKEIEGGSRSIDDDIIWPLLQ